MIDSYDPSTTIPGDLHCVGRELSRISGALEEIATVWRRAHHGRPGLPLDLPVRLARRTRQLAQRVSALVDVGPGQLAGRAVPVTEQLTALTRDIAAAEAMTSGAGLPAAGDAGLWKLVGAAVDSAGTRLGRLIGRLEADHRPSERPL
jgi:hypothetical protein